MAPSDLFLKLFRRFAALLCMAWVIDVAAQQPLRFDRLGREEGLSQSSVNCMVRDRDGFMWFGTQDGLNLYDGNRFRVFQNQPGDSASLSNNYIVSACEDEERKLWIGTMTGGLNCLDRYSERFTVFRHLDNRNSISENTVWTVLADGRGNIWAGTSLGLNRYNKKAGRFTNYRPVAADSTSLVTDLVVSLFRDSKGRIWVGTAEGLCVFDAATGKFRRYINPFEKELPGANLIWSMAETAEGEIVTGTNNGVYLLSLSTGKYRRILGSPVETQLVAWSLNVDKGNMVWVGTDRGLFCVGADGLKAGSWIHETGNQYSIADNNVWCLASDPAGFLWAGTNNGICKTKTTPAHFNLLTTNAGSPVVLSSSRVVAVLADRDGYLWVGTDGGGLNRISPGMKEVKVFNAANSGLRNDNIWSLTPDREGNIYIGSYQGGLHRYNRKTGTITAFPYNDGEPYSLSNPRILALLTGSDGKIWIGTRGGGLNSFDPVKNVFRVYQPTLGDKNEFPSNTVLSLAEDTKGHIWVGTQEGGLAMLIPGRDKFITYRHNISDRYSISDNNIWAILFDSKGRLWLATQGGLNVCEHPGEMMKFKHFTIRDGLRNNFLLGLQEDDDGNIWISSFSGLARLDIKTFESNTRQPATEGSFSFFQPLFSLFDTDHGIQGLEFNHGSSHKGRDGTIYFGGNNGLTSFTGRDVKTSSYIPPVVITGMKIFNREVGINSGSGNVKNVSAVLAVEDSYFLTGRITFLDEIRLTYRESVISFEFSSLDFSNPRKNRYAYKMLNFDKEWNYVGTQNTATYTNLDPGEYTLLVRGTNSDGAWNPRERALRIIISPPFWKTAWFLVTVSLMVLLAGFLTLRKIFLEQRTKAAMEKELIELQLKTIKSQIDPHFAFNAINTIAGYIYSEDPDVTYDYFTRFARLIRNILEDTEKISRTLHEETEFVRNYLELQKMRFKDKFEYTIVVDETLPGDILVPKMIIQSCAENAIKHGLMHLVSGGRLSILISRYHHGLRIIIEDNGIGREKAAQLNLDSTHRGIKIMQQIIEMYKKLYRVDIQQDIEDLKNNDGEALGTRVVLAMGLPDHSPPG